MAEDQSHGHLRQNDSGSSSVRTHAGGYGLVVPPSTCIMVPPAEGCQGQWCHAQAAQHGAGAAVHLHAIDDVSPGRIGFPSCEVVGCLLPYSSPEGWGLVKVPQQGAQDSGRQAALQTVESTPAYTEPAESDAMASVKVRREPETAFGLMASGLPWPSWQAACHVIWRLSAGSALLLLLMSCPQLYPRPQGANMSCAHA